MSSTLDEPIAPRASPIDNGEGGGRREQLIKQLWTLRMYVQNQLGCDQAKWVSLKSKNIKFYFLAFAICIIFKL